MELEHTFTVPVPPQQAFSVMQDIERIGPCMPGATIESVDGRTFTGSVKVKIGPIKVTYAGEAEYAEVDEDALTATIKAKGKETRGSGTANATVTASLQEVADGTRVHVVTDLAVTGRPAQFGRGVMEEVGQKLINDFADCLATTLGEDEQEEEAAPAEDQADQQPAAGSTPTSAPTAARPTPASSTPRPSSDSIDLLDVAGAPVARRAAPVLAVVALAVVWWLVRRR